MAALPTPEALTLAANVFHADIDAWLPPSFGVTRTAEEKEAEWAAARSFAALRGSDRLGLGHPDMDDPEARRAAQVSRAGGDILKRTLKRKSEGEDESSAPATQASRGDDDESRTKAVSSKKRKTADAFKSKGKKEAVHPLLNLKNPIPGYDAPAETKQAPKVKKTKVVGESVNAAAALAASLNTGSATMRVVTKGSVPAAPKLAAPTSPKASKTASVPASPEASKADSALHSPKHAKLSTPGSPSAKKVPPVTGSIVASEAGEGTFTSAQPMSKAALRRAKRKAAKVRKSL
ncbi:hypothetical protein CC85DRAFT_283030 [Cutaneotrichosporon oleaginosum]|uniref:Uncharacterized protein n=1 Tax=Cutaneotrichosporon oleaginosum TaxID=879819 RepID=A0A0J0XVL5_9TREE|nr:uncharacterized protein CC85DRAFT_283030 [Cutaneotrichosporon oleaginosum]KLT45117.1 hypothetical protein CC85DRAFT_283030 [Cutaneotrichosporon oleaginosum]TXT09797.1 hypothetical protein COLE_03731 [Cutaneotrichosporon oleaginosum]